MVVAVPGDAIAEGLATVSGLNVQVTIDATNKCGDRPVGYDAVAQQVKSIIGRSTSKAFNTNFASLYDQIAVESVRPGTCSPLTLRLARSPSS